MAVYIIYAASVKQLHQHSIIIKHACSHLRQEANRADTQHVSSTERLTNEFETNWELWLPVLVVTAKLAANQLREGVH